MGSWLALTCYNNEKFKISPAFALFQSNSLVALVVYCKQGITCESFIFLARLDSSGLHQHRETFLSLFMQFFPAEAGSGFVVISYNPFFFSFSKFGVEVNSKANSAISNFNYVCLRIVIVLAE